eukprot:Skav212416  [mRNA]  locus=scaffold202:49654:50949:+ [translate_table: standard]
MLTGPLLTGPLLGLGHACPAFLPDFEETFGHLQEFEVPCFVVAGMTSAGKSTLLQRLTQMPFFPSDKQMCTRVPIKVEMRRGSGEPKATVTVYHYDDEHKMFFEDETEGESLSIGAASTEVQQKMKSLLEKAGLAKTSRRVIIDKELRIRISSSALPILDVVDLPGVVKGATKLANDTQKLLKRYVLTSGTHSNFLYVVPATIPELEWNADQLLGHGDELTGMQLPERSLGVITYCDNIKPDEDAEVLGYLCQYLSGEFDPEDDDFVKLGHGYFALGANSSRYAHEEEAVFAKLLRFWPDSARMKKRTSISSLQSKVRKLYEDQVCDRWLPMLVQKLVEWWIRSCVASQPLEQMNLCDKIVKDLVQHYKDCRNSDLELEEISQYMSPENWSKLRHGPSGTCKNLIQPWLKAEQQHPSWANDSVVILQYICG